jgi:hypothetical protein
LASGGILHQARFLSEAYSGSTDGIHGVGSVRDHASDHRMAGATSLACAAGATNLTERTTATIDATLDLAVRDGFAEADNHGLGRSRLERNLEDLLMILILTIESSAKFHRL